MAHSKRTNRTIAMSIAALAVLAVAAPGASAASTVECVGFAPGAAPADCTTLHDASALQAALLAAKDADADIVRIAPGTYDGSFSAVGNASDRIVGSGIDQTLLRNATPGGSTALTLLGAAGQEVVASELSVERTGATSTHFTVDATYAILDHVRVRVNAGMEQGRGVQAANAIMSHSIIETAGTASHGVYASNGDVLVEDSTIIPLAPSSVGVYLSSVSNTATVRRTRIGDPTGANAFGLGIGTDGGHILVEDSLIDLGASVGATGVSAYNSNAGSATAIAGDVLRTTVVGTGSNQRAIRVGTAGPAQMTTMQISDSVIDVGASAYAVECRWPMGGSTPTLAMTRVAIAGTFTSWFQPCVFTTTDNIDLGATAPTTRFVDPVLHDYRPLPGGVLIDAGDATFVATTGDVLGAARVVDGDDDGVARLDLGAYEFAVVTAPEPVTGTGPVTPVIPVNPVTPETPQDTIRPTLSVAGPTNALPFLRTGKLAFAFAKARERRAIRLTVSEDSAVTITVARKFGRKYVIVKGRQAMQLKAGTRRIGWAGKWQGAVLPIGTYRITVVAQDAAGNISAPRSLVLRLAPAAK